MKYTFLLAFVVHFQMVFSQESTPDSSIQRQLDTYNNRDIEGFMALFHEDVQLYNQADGKLLADGKAAVRKIYSHLFERSPKLHSELINRIVLNNTFIDHERITGRMGNEEAIELIVIYELSALKIIKVTVIR